MTSDQAFQAFEARKVFGSLNGLRALCVGLVLWHHSPALAGLEGGARILSRGFTGVDFFFVLSGFLITTLLIREERRHGAFSLAGFYWRRMLRIVPVYFLIVTGVGGYYVLVKGQWDLAPLLPYYYLFFSNMLIGEIPTLAPTWSLAVEEQFYLLWPLALTVLPRRAALRGAVVLGLIVVFVGVAAQVIPWFDPLETRHGRWQVPVSSFAAILSGVLLALVMSTRAGFSAVWILVHRRWSVPLLAVLLLGMWQVFPGVLLGGPNLLMHTVMTLILAGLVVREDHAAAPVLRWLPLRRIGEISYGIYLYHLIGLHFARGVFAPLGMTVETAPWLISAAFVAISVLMAELSFRGFESHFLKMKARGGGPRARPDHMKKI